MKNLMIIVILFVAMIMVASADDTASPGKVLLNVDFAESPAPTTVSLTSRYCWDVGNYLEFYARDSSLTVKFKLPGGKYESCSLIVTDRGSVLPMPIASPYKSPVYYPFTISVNGSVVAKDVDIDWISDKESVYDIGGLLREGDNSITFTLSPVSNTRYDLRNITVRCR